tara:strand:+ start:582 stop:1202 length:621 start_codon:yes stop_codon:yes gene_type:complete
MKQHKYNSYEEYVLYQIEAGTRKMNDQNTTEDEMVFVSGIIKDLIPNAKFGLCHGTRGGLEQLILIRELDIEVLGTEISPKAADKFPHTIEWDFNKVKDEWINSVDFIYSNSFDHVFDPKEGLKTWMSCIKPSGFCILHWDKQHSDKYTRPKESDPFGASLEEYKKLIEDCGFNVHEIREYTESTWRNKYAKNNPVQYILINHKGE